MIMRMFMRLGAVTQVVPAGQGSPLQPEPESGLSSGWGSRCEPRWGCTGRRTSCGLAPWPGIGGGGSRASQRAEKLTPVKVGSILLIPRLVHDQHPPRLRLVCADLHLMSTVFS